VGKEVAASLDLFSGVLLGRSCLKAAKLNSNALAVANEHGSVVGGKAVFPKTASVVSRPLDGRSGKEGVCLRASGSDKCVNLSTFKIIC
jgi:hypothetical protein